MKILVLPWRQKVIETYGFHEEHEGSRVMIEFYILKSNLRMLMFGASFCLEQIIVEKN